MTLKRLRLVDLAELFIFIIFAAGFAVSAYWLIDLLMKAVAPSWIWVRWILPALIAAFFSMIFVEVTADRYRGWAVIAKVVSPNPRRFLQGLRRASIDPGRVGVNYWEALPALHQYIVNRAGSSRENLKKSILELVKDLPGVTKVVQTGKPNDLGLPKWSVDLLPAVEGHEAEFDDGPLWARYLLLLRKGTSARTVDDVIEASFEWEKLGELAAPAEVILNEDVEWVAALIDAIEDVRTASSRRGAERTSRLADAVELLARVAERATDPLLRDMARNWRSVVNRELEENQAGAELSLAAPDSIVIAGLDASVVGILRNDGEGFAGRVTIRAENAEIAVTPPSIDALPPRGEERVYFRLPASQAKPGPFTLTVIVDYLQSRTPRSQRFDLTIEVLSPAIPSKELTLRNPYETGTPIRDNASPVFYGRDDVFQQIAKRLDQDRRKQGGKSILLIVGERRLGKTSVLLQLDHQLGGDYIPVFCDAQGFNDSGDAAFLGWLGGHIRRKLRERGIEVKPPTILELAAGPTPVFSDFVHDQLMPALEGKCLLLLFDEFERMEDLIREGKQSAGILLFLRDLMQHAAGISFLFAGTHRLLEMAAQSSSIMFNIAQTIRLEYLSFEDLKRLVIEPVAGALTFDREAPHTVFELTAGHPFLSQLLCFGLVEQQKRLQKAYVSLTDVENAARVLVRTGQTHFEYLVSELDPLALVLLSGMATWFEGRPALASDLAGRLTSYRLDPRELEVPRRLERLADSGHLVSSKESSTHRLYRFRLQILRIWLAEHRPFDDALRRYLRSQETVMTPLEDFDEPEPDRPPAKKQSRRKK